MPYLNHVLDKGGLGGAGKPRGLWVLLVLGLGLIYPYPM